MFSSALEIQVFHLLTSAVQRDISLQTSFVAQLNVSLNNLCPRFQGNTWTRPDLSDSK